MKEESATRSKFYEQLETTIFELERTNNQLSRKHQVDKKRIQSLCENIDYLEKKCEEMNTTLEQLETIRDEQSRKHYGAGGGKMSKSSYFNYGSDSLSSEDSVDFGFRTRSHSLHDLRVRSPDEFDSGNSSNSPTDLKTSESEFIFALESRIEQLLTAKKQEMEKIHQMETQLRILIQENANLQEQLNLVQAEKDEQILELRKQLLDTSNYAQQTLTLSMAAHLNIENFSQNPIKNSSSSQRATSNTNNTSDSSPQSLLSERKLTVDFCSSQPSSSQLLQNGRSPNNSNSSSSDNNHNQQQSASSSPNTNVSSEISSIAFNNLLGTSFNPSSSSNLVSTPNQNAVENISDKVNHCSSSNNNNSTTLVVSTAVGPHSSCNLLCTRCSTEINLLNLVNAIENDDEETQDFNSLEYELARATNQSMRHSLNLYENQKSRGDKNSLADNHDWNNLKSPWASSLPSLDMNLPDLLPYAFEEEIGEEACEIPIDFVSTSSHENSSSRRSSKVIDDEEEDACLRKDRYPEKSKNKSSNQSHQKFKHAKLDYKEIPKKIPCDVDDDDDGMSSLFNTNSNSGDTVDSGSTENKLVELGNEGKKTNSELKSKKAPRTEEKKKKGVNFRSTSTVIEEEPEFQNEFFSPPVSVFLTPAPPSSSSPPPSELSSLEKLYFHDPQPEYKLIFEKLKDLFMISKRTYPGVYPFLHQHGT